MHKRTKQLIAAALMILLETVSPVLLAQAQKPTSSVARDTAGSTAEGKVLWQYNTNG